jgi:hypothetical protein
LNQTLIEQYTRVITPNRLYQRNSNYWNFLLNSYMGGIEYQRAGMLTRYVNETEQEYNARLQATHYENHCKSVISTYVSFMFRTPPRREYGGLESDAALPDFLSDADLDGRSFDAFMQEVAVWSSVFGHCWVMVVKPNVGAVTRADELAIGARPYVSLMTPITVFDWHWTRGVTGRYVLDYFKYTEEANDTISVIKEWRLDTITTYTVDHQRKEIREQVEEVNELGQIPAVLAYNHRSPVRGIGVSDISDIASASKFIYNLTSEVEQSVRINGHPALVKTPGTEATAGAGAIIQMEDNLDPGLKPYMLTVSTDTDSIYNAVKHTVSAIDKMANTGGVRGTEAVSMSGIAREHEFQLLNAKLSEKAKNIELTEEQIWTLYAAYQGQDWTGMVEYPSSFAIRDVHNELAQLKLARETATDPRVLAEIDRLLLDALGLDADIVLMQSDSGDFTPHIMVNPTTGEQRMAESEEQHLELSARGWIHTD